MGEYVEWHGQPWKIGTCESLYYVRYQDYRRMFEDNELAYHVGNAQPGSYLEGAYRFRFPFPFPDEDGQAGGIHGWQDFDRGWIVYAPLTWMRGLVAHNDTLANVVGIFGAKLPANVPQPRIRLRCPQSGEEVPGLGFKDNGYLYIEIVQQRPYDGALWTVCRCPYCGTRWRVPPEHAAELHLHILREYAERPDVLELAARMMEGYSVQTHTKPEEG